MSGEFLGYLIAILFVLAVVYKFKKSEKRKPNTPVPCEPSLTQGVEVGKNTYGIKGLSECITVIKVEDGKVFYIFDTPELDPVKELTIEQFLDTYDHFPCGTCKARVIGSLEP